MFIKVLIVLTLLIPLALMVYYLLYVLINDKDIE
jgi:hypothetical protein